MLQVQLIAGQITTANRRDIGLSTLALLILWEKACNANGRFAVFVHNYLYLDECIRSIQSISIELGHRCFGYCCCWGTTYKRKKTRVGVFPFTCFSLWHGKRLSLIMELWALVRASAESQLASSSASTWVALSLDRYAGECLVSWMELFDSHSPISNMQDPRDVERIWDQMFRATLPYGRKGLTIHAIRYSSCSRSGWSKDLCLLAINVVQLIWRCGIAWEKSFRSQSTSLLEGKPKIEYERLMHVTECWSKTAACDSREKYSNHQWASLQESILLLTFITQTVFSCQYTAQLDGPILRKNWGSKQPSSRFHMALLTEKRGFKSMKQYRQPRFRACISYWHDKNNSNVRNLDRIAEVRKSVSPTFPIRIDCYSKAYQGGCFNRQTHLCLLYSGPDCPVLDSPH